MYGITKHEMIKNTGVSTITHKVLFSITLVIKDGVVYEQ